MMLMYVSKLEVYAVLNGSRNEKNIDYWKDDSLIAVAIYKEIRINGFYHVLQSQADWVRERDCCESISRYAC